MKQHRRSVFGVVLLVFSSGWHGWREQAPRDTEPDANYALVIFGTDTIRAEVAQTDQERQRGLMFRESVPDGSGMLFVFQRPEVQGIWMKDTYVPLDVAFLDTQLRVLNIEHLEPLDLTTKRSQGPALFALEVRQGWFADHSIGVGDQAEVVFGVR